MPRLNVASQLTSSLPNDEDNDFEAQLLHHICQLACPESFIESIRGKFDYSRVRVRLITTQPGSYSQGNYSHLFGLLRLTRVIRKLGLQRQLIHLESCSGSVGRLNPEWLHRFYNATIGRRNKASHVFPEELPSIEVIYPTKADVQKSTFGEQVRCHLFICMVRSGTA